jgi:hypothetical protein
VSVFYGGVTCQRLLEREPFSKHGVARVIGCPIAQNTSPLHLEKEIQLPSAGGRTDHFCADVRGQRLFIAALENRTVEVLNIRKGERSTEIKGLSEPQGVFYSSQNDELYVASGGDGTLRIYDGTTLKLRQTLEFGADRVGPAHP